MNTYSLEVENWGNWELEKDFSSINLARTYGLNRLPQNNWRVIYRPTGEIVSEYNYTTQLEEVAQQELERFRNRDIWRERFATNRHNIVNSVASNQRRRHRLNNFNFVSLSPDHFYMEDYVSKSKSDKINWQKEGF